MQGKSCTETHTVEKEATKQLAMTDKLMKELVTAGAGGDEAKARAELEAGSASRVWVVPPQTRQGAAIDAPTEYHALDAEVYRLVPALFR